MARRTVREWRAFRKLTKSSIAARLGVHSGTYKRMEDHPEKTTFEEALRLADVFGCKVGEIIFFEKNPNLMLGELVGS